MCGIAGIFHYADPERQVDRGLVERMTRVLTHRGPDAEGFFFRDGVGFGHRRLSIVDLSATGAQPMSNDDGTCWIIYNGEFYNHRDFRTRLASRGHRFRGTSDTETLLRLMEEDGPECLAQTAGIFAFAFWDDRKQTLTLARDPLGVKQLYFHDNGRRVIFASEIKALLQDPEVSRSVDPEAVNQYLHFHTPLFERTFFRGIHQLRAGEYMRISRYGALTNRYWTLTDFTKSARPENETVDDLRHHLEQIVEQQLMSDVPVGSFFSGGIDSSAVAAFASKVGRKPICFGVHFSGQGVTDERPYQEAAARALHLDLRLITLDGTGFPDEFRRLMYHQDQPVIGAAMFPMARVSKLASESVKVCLGGQAADEIFGGYARYALGRPGLVLRSWFSNRRSGQAEKGEAKVGSNLSRQMAEGGTLFRLARNARHLIHWETAYFEHFVKVPEQEWKKLFGSPEFCSRDRCSQLFREVTHRSPASDPMDKVMHWDLQTYLTGLFQQDDRMSMANSLESRVPFADPRLVRFAFGIGPDLRFRGGSSKWILRKAVSTMLPALVLGRRKVGFDTPAEAWMQQHTGFVRDTLLSSRALSRGMWDRQGVESLLSNSGAAGQFDVLWKAMSIELWASVFLDNGPADVARPAPVPEIRSEEAAIPASRRIQYAVQEVVELRARGTIARAKWELSTRSGLTRLLSPGAGGSGAKLLAGGKWNLPFSPPGAAGDAIRELLTPADRQHLGELASEATRGHIQCFGRWMADFGSPIDWFRDPCNEHRWPSTAHWTKALRIGPEPTEVKFTWEAARFPQALILGRAAAINPASAADLAAAFCAQVSSFIERNPVGLGLHWYSGQEIALRAMSWLFGIHVFSGLGLIPESLKSSVAAHMAESGAHIARHIEFARRSIYNNHLLAEALGLYFTGTLLHGEEADRWARDGRDILTVEADKQVYADGAYIQHSHNYHRVAMKTYLWAAAFARANGEEVPRPWTQAMERSMDFLLAQQNPTDGRLPNYGSNDGSDPVRTAGIDFSDFRGVLQTLSVETRGERLYPAGPWDEQAIWHGGPAVLRLPQRALRRMSVSFPDSGYHVLRGHTEETFCTFRCGTITDRFSQIDMLHLDVWWRGQNVLVDGGSYLYNGAKVWHDHFMRTGSHNTVQVDGQEQMPHLRQFKTLYPTRAKLLRFEDQEAWAISEGEHYGYQRNEHTLHRRAVLFLKDAETWVVVDTLTGSGTHKARLHWLGGEYEYDFEPTEARVLLKTPRGDFGISILDGNGQPLTTSTVVTGQQMPPRGWLSRYYGEKVAVPSFAAVQECALPVTFVSLAGPGKPDVRMRDGVWSVTVSGNSARFGIEGGLFQNLQIVGQPVAEPRT